MRLLAQVCVLALSAAVLAGHSYKEDQSSAAIYAYGSKRIRASDEYAQVAMRFTRGSTLSLGASITEPEAFNYAALNVFGTQLQNFCLPYFQLGYSRYVAQNSMGFDEAEKQGLLLGLGAACALSHYASVDFTVKRLNDHADLRTDSISLASVGLKFKF